MGNPPGVIETIAARVCMRGAPSFTCGAQALAAFDQFREEPSAPPESHESPA